MAAVAYQYGWIVTCTAIGEQARFKVEPTDEHGYKHIHVVVARNDFVQLSDDVAASHLLKGEGTGKTLCHCHIERCWYSLATHVANTDEKFLLVLAQLEVVEVATHFLHGFQPTVDVDGGACRLSVERLG